MRTAVILLLCILGAALFCTVSCYSSNGPDNCCFNFFPGRLSPSRVRSFILTDDHCPKAGVIFVTRRNLNICVDWNATWVQEILQTLVGTAPPPACPPTRPPAPPSALPTAPPTAPPHGFCRFV